MHSLVTTNIFRRVFKIESQGTLLGTGFVVERGQQQFLVTARHVVAGASNMTISNAHLWANLSGDPLPGVNPDVDIAVFALPPSRPSLEHYKVKFTSEGIVFSQDVFFLGYPYGLSCLDSKGRTVVPFVKKAVVSAMDASHGIGLFYLDGINNLGFSGGPVCTGGDDSQILAIVSGYEQEMCDVQPGPLERTLEASVAVNAGIIICYDIRHAMEVLPPAQ